MQNFDDMYNVGTKALKDLAKPLVREALKLKLSSAEQKALSIQKKALLKTQELIAELVNDMDEVDILDILEQKKIILDAERTAEEISLLRKQLLGDES